MALKFEINFKYCDSFLTWRNENIYMIVKRRSNFVKPRKKRLFTTLTSIQNLFELLITSGQIKNNKAKSRK